MVVNNPEQKVRSRFGPEYIFIAKNNDGLREIYELTKTAYDKFYYKAQISIDDMIGVSDNVFVICECPETLDRIDYIGLSQKTPKMMLQFDIPKVAISQNRYPTPQDKQAYQLLAGARKSGNGWNFRFNDQTYPQHILTTEEWFRIWRDEEAINNTHKIADQCNVEIPKAKMVLFDSPISIEQLSRKGAIEK
jgi:DNA polymerase III alpha subunit